MSGTSSCYGSPADLSKVSLIGSMCVGSSQSDGWQFKGRFCDLRGPD